MNSSDAYFDKMTKTSLVKLIVMLGIPTTISMLVTNIYNMADTYFVGTLGESQQAATGILYTLQAIIQAVAFMLGQGSGTLVSKSLADKNKNEASTYASSGFYSGIALGIIISVLGLTFLTPLMKLLGSTDTILPYAREYGACVLLTCPFVIGSFILNNNLRYEGMAVYSMVGLVSGSIINIFGDYLLVIVYNFGVLGAGIATAVSQVISFFILVYFFNKNAQSKISIKHLSHKFGVYLNISKIGFPAMIRQGLTSFSGGLLNNLTRPFGDVAIAAMSVVNRYSMFVMCVGLGIGQGFQPVASFNYRAKFYKRVKQSLIITMLIGFCCILLMAMPGFLFPETIVRLFQTNSEVIKIGALALRFSSVGIIFLSLSVPVNMLYQSIRRPLMSSFLSILRSGLMLIPVLIISTKYLGLLGIQFSQPLSDVLTGLVSIPFIISFLKLKDEDMKV